MTRPPSLRLLGIGVCLPPGTLESVVKPVIVDTLLPALMAGQLSMAPREDAGVEPRGGAGADNCPSNVLCLSLDGNGGAGGEDGNDDDDSSGDGGDGEDHVHDDDGDDYDEMRMQ